ncbi:hypothetical protein [Ruminococcus sp.]|uniref:hypothetical protein n=1 Tax=Ruminococcus sp. TaxID=41978 RepID=UPI003F103B6C
MKKVLALIMVLSMAVACSACGANENKEQSSENSSTTSIYIEETTSESETQAETIDINSMTDSEFADKIANDFSIKNVSFKVESISETMAFLETTGSDNISVRIGFSEYGNNITLSFVTDGGEDECYYVLQQALQSDVFNIPFDDQIDILAHYMVDEIDYEGSSVSITETINNNIRVIGMRLQ